MANRIIDRLSDYKEMPDRFLSPSEHTQRSTAIGAAAYLTGKQLVMHGITVG